MHFADRLTVGFSILWPAHEPIESPYLSVPRNRFLAMNFTGRVTYLIAILWRAEKPLAHHILASPHFGEPMNSWIYKTVAAD